MKMVQWFLFGIAVSCFSRCKGQVNIPSRISSFFRGNAAKDNFPRPGLGDTATTNGRAGLPSIPAKALPAAILPNKKEISQSEATIPSSSSTPAMCPTLRLYLENPFSYLEIISSETEEEEDEFQMSTANRHKDFLAPRRKVFNSVDNINNETRINNTKNNNTQTATKIKSPSSLARRRFTTAMREAIQALDRLDVDDRVRLFKKRNAFRMPHTSHAKNSFTDCDTSLPPSEAFSEFVSPEAPKAESMKRWKLEILRLRQEKVNQQRRRQQQTTWSLLFGAAKNTKEELPKPDDITTK
eukprot:TRINITY_DN74645_c0_g1_i2.p1 TRINITY_DN74645_c0_g1~~TRINITY_DN74645_c0_g1_i2.p1  ORF type:complete len:298 (-),score=47.69 TRINITY_DN74645_c0_g1_i2:239-1132(-)